MAVGRSRGHRRRIDGILGGQAGATSVEYALMVGAIAVVIIVAVAFLGQNLRSDFDCSGSAVESMPSPPACNP